MVEGDQSCLMHHSTINTTPTAYNNNLSLKTQTYLIAKKQDVVGVNSGCLFICSNGFIELLLFVQCVALLLGGHGGSLGVCGGFLFGREGGGGSRCGRRGGIGHEIHRRGAVAVLSTHKHCLQYLHHLGVLQHRIRIALHHRELLLEGRVGELGAEFGVASCVLCIACVCVFACQYRCMSICAYVF